MKIQVLSDTHNQWDRVIINPEVDLVIHAGDLSDGFNLYEQTKILDEVCNGKDYLYVLGNHDYWNSNLGVYDDSRLLVRGKPVEIKGKTFVGCTLWSGFYGVDLEEATEIYRYIGDSIYTPMSVTDMIREHNLDLEFLNKYRGVPDTVVVTHFPLSQDLLDPKFEGNRLNPYFINDISLEGFSLVISGHTHHVKDLKIGDCRLILNAHGYPNEVPEFNPNFIIEV